ncbi:class I adenylate-forming enzyme family protein [Novosphingobium tardum]|uniref:Class I adenylate-forming enzyme family protein n=1 Tax=Novosphingobium tardum TaxID=1538021 RepID=A0ABV8RSI9_9SPHN
MTDKLRAIMAIDPARAEIDFGGQDYTWGQIARTVEEVIAALATLDLPADARVGVMLRNKPGHVAAALAVLASDRCLVTLNPALPDTALVADCVGLHLPVVVLDHDDLSRPGMADGLAQAGSAVIAFGAHLEGARLVSRGAGVPPSMAPGVAIEMLTSGTTGRPKRVPLTRAAFDASFAGFTRYERGRDYADQPQLRSGVTMIVNPLTHIGGIYGCIGALMAGRKIALLERFTVDAWVDAIRRNRPKVASAVPAAIRMILEANVPPEALSSLTAMISGTAPLDPETIDRFHARYGVPILTNYGATEFAGAIAGWSIDDFRAHWADKRGAAGRIHADVDARVVDPETGVLTGPQGEGVLEIRGAQLGNGMKWLRTTDRARIDEEGFLFILGRADNAIIRGGFKIHPDDIVSALQAHPAVREAAALGLPDERLGQVPAAVVILKDGAAPTSPEDLLAFLKQRLLPYQVPVHLRVVPDFPRTPSMKPSAPGLRALFGDEA